MRIYVYFNQLGYDDSDKQVIFGCGKHHNQIGKLQIWILAGMCGMSNVHKTQGHTA